MAETELPKTMLESNWSQTGVVLVMTGLDPANGNFFMGHRDCVVVVQNIDVAPQTFRVTSQPHPDTERTGDINQILQPDELRAFRLCRPGWADAEDLVHVPSGQSANLLVGIMPLDPMTG